MTIKLGDVVKDNITGFTGVAVCQLVYVWGCIQYGVQPTECKKDGELPDTMYLDEDRLEVVTKAKDRGKKTKTTGGVYDTPPERGRM